MELKEANISSSAELENLLAKLRGMQFRRELKLTRGSFDFQGTVDAEFKLKNSSDEWRLYCTERAGGYLRKI
jgi:hypothetical protein